MTIKIASVTVNSNDELVIDIDNATPVASLNEALTTTKVGTFVLLLSNAE